MIGGGAGIFVFAFEELILEARGEMCWEFRMEWNRSTEPVLEPKTLGSSRRSMSEYRARRPCTTLLPHRIPRGLIDGV